MQFSPVLIPATQASYFFTSPHFSPYSQAKGTIMVQGRIAPKQKHSKRVKSMADKEHGLGRVTRARQRGLHSDSRMPKCNSFPSIRDTHGVGRVSCHSARGKCFCRFLDTGNQACSTLLLPFQQYGPHSGFCFLDIICLSS